jgi:hypothetical protein
MGIVIGWIVAVGLACMLAVVGFRVVRSWMHAGRDL